MVRRMRIIGLTRRHSHQLSLERTVAKTLDNRRGEERQAREGTRLGKIHDIMEVEPPVGEDFLCVCPTHMCSRTLGSVVFHS